MTHDTTLEEPALPTLASRRRAAIRDPGHAPLCDWYDLKWQLELYRKHYGVCLRPDYQRGHVWSESQRRAWLEWKIEGGAGGEDILWNCPGHSSGPSVTGPVGPMELVDGAQRLESVRRLLAGEIRVFGQTLAEDPEPPRRALQGLHFRMRVHHLTRRADVLRWYLGHNGGGTPHTAEELARVRDLLVRAQGEEERSE